MGGVSGLIALFFISMGLLTNVTGNLRPERHLDADDTVTFCAALTGLALLITELIWRLKTSFRRRRNPEISHRSPLYCLSGVLGLAYAGGYILRIHYYKRNQNENDPAIQTLLMTYIGAVGVVVASAEFTYEFMCFIRYFCKQQSEMNAAHLNLVRGLCGALAFANLGALAISSHGVPRLAHPDTALGIVIVALAAAQIVYQLFIRNKQKCNSTLENDNENAKLPEKNLV